MSRVDHVQNSNKKDLEVLSMKMKVDNYFFGYLDLSQVIMLQRLSSLFVYIEKNISSFHDPEGSIAPYEQFLRR